MLGHIHNQSHEGIFFIKLLCSNSPIRRTQKAAITSMSTLVVLKVYKSVSGSCSLADVVEDCYRIGSTGM